MDLLEQRRSQMILLALRSDAICRSRRISSGAPVFHQLTSTEPRHCPSSGHAVISSSSGLGILFSPIVCASRVPGRLRCTLPEARTLFCMVCGGISTHQSMMSTGFAFTLTSLHAPVRQRLVPVPWDGLSHPSLLQDCIDTVRPSGCQP